MEGRDSDAEPFQEEIWSKKEECFPSWETEEVKNEELER